MNRVSASFFLTQMGMLVSQDYSQVSWQYNKYHDFDIMYTGGLFTGLEIERGGCKAQNTPNFDIVEWNKHKFCYSCKWDK